jgi:polyisoprenoid-binding protein YceI
MSVGPIEGPGYVTGTWAIDPAHSDVGFAVRHLMISNVKGHFTRFGGRIVAAEDPLKPEMTATIDMTAVDTANAMRDEHLRAADFFEVEPPTSSRSRSTPP